MGGELEVRGWEGSWGEGVGGELEVRGWEGSWGEGVGGGGRGAGVRGWEGSWRWGCLLVEYVAIFPVLLMSLTVWYVCHPSTLLTSLTSSPPSLLLLSSSSPPPLLLLSSSPPPLLLLLYKDVTPLHCVGMLHTPLAMLICILYKYM